ncbi:MAG: hypothetical protein JSU73_10980 [candidate division WOR-3 bacterium]|nr:MAG: hypothetical protein JSU73_10980 [candidate division WOR-3 bacterium]
MVLLLVGGPVADGLADEAELPEFPESTTPVADSAVPDSTPVPVEARPAKAGKSPGTAVLLSALIPGGGQVYTGGYWKAGLIAPAELALGFFSVKEHLDATRALEQGREADYVLHRDRRTALLWWTGAVIAFSMADAYVSARLYDFDEQMRFSQTIRVLQPSSTISRLTLAIRPARAGIEFRL